jgi:hypothetical protein
VRQVFAAWRRAVRVYVPLVQAEDAPSCNSRYSFGLVWSEAGRENALRSPVQIACPLVVGTEEQTIAALDLGGLALLGVAPDKPDRPSLRHLHALALSGIVEVHADARHAQFVTGLLAYDCVPERIQQSELALSSSTSQAAAWRAS